jgi:hypothetical protein
MAIWDDMFEGSTGIVIAVGALVLAPLARPVLRPFAKQVIKTGLVLYDKASVAMAEVSEGMEDLVAEARAEMAEHPHPGGEQKHQPALQKGAV